MDLGFESLRAKGAWSNAVCIWIGVFTRLLHGWKYSENELKMSLFCPWKEVKDKHHVFAETFCKHQSFQNIVSGIFFFHNSHIIYSYISCNYPINIQCQSNICRQQNNLNITVHVIQLNGMYYCKNKKHSWNVNTLQNIQFQLNKQSSSQSHIQAYWRCFLRPVMKRGCWTTLS